MSAQAAPSSKVFVHRITVEVHGGVGDLLKSTRFGDGEGGGLIEEGEVADLVPYRPAFRRRGRVPADLAQQGNHLIQFGVLGSKVVPEISEGRLCVSHAAQATGGSRSEGSRARTLRNFLSLRAQLQFAPIRWGYGSGPLARRP